MLGQVSQVDATIQNNASIKSQETVPQATGHQIFFNQCFRFPNASIQCQKQLNVGGFESATTLSKPRKKVRQKREAVR